MASLGASLRFCADWPVNHDNILAASVLCLSYFPGSRKNDRIFLCYMANIKGRNPSQQQRRRLENNALLSIDGCSQAFAFLKIGKTKEKQVDSGSSFVREREQRALSCLFAHNVVAWMKGKKVMMLLPLQEERRRRWRMTSSRLGRPAAVQSAR